MLSSEAEDDVPPALKPYSWSNVTVILVVSAALMLLGTFFSLFGLEKFALTAAISLAG